MNPGAEPTPLVIHVLPVLQPAGAERIAAELAVRLPRHGFETRVICLEDERAPIGAELTAAGVPVEGLRISRRRTLACALALAGRLPAGRPLVLHGHLFHANLVTRLALRRLSREARQDVRVINTIQVVERRFRPWQFWLDRWTAKYCAAEVCVSEDVRQFQRVKTGLPESFFRVIENAVDIERFAPREQNTGTQSNVPSIHRPDLESRVQEHSPVREIRRPDSERPEGAQKHSPGREPWGYDRIIPLQSPEGAPHSEKAAPLQGSDVSSPAADPALAPGAELQRPVRAAERAVQVASAAERLVQPRSPHILAVGRLDPQKDYATLLRAWQFVCAHRPDARLTIAGSGPEREKLVALAKSLALNNVDFLGFVADIPALLHQADLFVQSSLWEGLPLSVIEAMAGSLPIVATDAEGTRNVIEHDRTGLLVPRSDPRALAEAILRLLSDPQESARLASAARATAVQRFSVDAMVAKYAALYRELLPQTRN